MRVGIFPTGGKYLHDRMIFYDIFASYFPAVRENTIQHNRVDLIGRVLLR
jgi:hypothetical protein